MGRNKKNCRQVVFDYKRLETKRAIIVITDYKELRMQEETRSLGKLTAVAIYNPI